MFHKNILKILKIDKNFFSMDLVLINEKISIMYSGLINGKFEIPL